MDSFKQLTSFLSIAQVHSLASKSEVKLMITLDKGAIVWFAEGAWFDNRHSEQAISSSVKQ